MKTTQELLKEIENIVELNNHQRRNYEHTIALFRDKIDELTGILVKETETYKVWQCANCRSEFYGAIFGIKERKCPSCSEGIVISIKQKQIDDIVKENELLKMLVNKQVA